ncbi:MAG: RNA polymerase sigma-54 factor [Bdellovibrionota bacterium]
MALDIRQSLKLTQSLLMTPQLQQAIKLLQLGRLELEQFVSQQLSENPVLEEGIIESAEEANQVAKEREKTTEDVLRDQMSEAADMMDKVEPGQKKDELDWEALSRLKEAGQQPTSSTRNNQSDEAPNYENIVTKSATLSDYLYEQIGELDFSDNEKEIAALIIGNIDEKGYLAIDFDELCQSESLDRDEAEGVLDTIQRLDPPGIGARNLQECLINQLRSTGVKSKIVEKIIRHHMAELETRNFDVISKSLAIPVEEVIENVAIVAGLDPIPGRQFGADASQYVIPDVYVFKLGGEWVVSLNEEGLPKLRLNEYYQGINNKVTGEEKEYIQEKLKSAQWLIKSIQQRQRTIFRATECIVKRQKEFLRKVFIV